MSCDYCDEWQGLETIYTKIYGSRNRVVHETKSFLAFPCMGQLREGHLLIASRIHKNAIGMLDADTILELEGLIENVATFFQHTYQQDLLCFEHGVLNDQGDNGGCGIYHMHLHLIPANQAEFLSVLKLIQQDKANDVCPVQGLLDAHRYVSNQKTYIFFAFLSQMQKQDAFIVSNSDNFFESQYMRKIVSKVFKRTDWNWKKIKEPEVALLKTLDKGYSFFHH